MIEEYLNKVIQGDCLEVMKQLPDKCIDLVLTDPPYGTTQNEWDEIVPLDKMWEQYLRVGKDNCSYILTSAQPFTTALINSNPRMFKYDLIFEKTLASGFLNAKVMPLRSHEEILIFNKGKTKYYPKMGTGVNKKGIDRRGSNGTNYGAYTKKDRSYDDEGKRYPKSVIRFSTGNRTVERFHPTQKPVELMSYLIQTYSDAEDIILDSFMGSGTTAVAAKQLGRNYIGIEISEKYCAIARERLRQEILL